MSALLPPPSRSRAVQRTLAIILVLNLAVVVVKAVVWQRSGSLSVLGAAVESLLDAMNNGIAMLLVGLAAQGPDDDHPYGHDKFETLGALAVVGFLSISCFELLRGAITELLTGATPPTPEPLEMALLASTALVNLGVVWYERRQGRRLQSQLLTADAAHTAGDVWVTLLAFASLLLTRAGWAHADAVLAIIVAVVIAWNGWGILRETVPILVDARAVDADEVRAAIAGIAGVRDVRRIRSRTAATGARFVEVTIGVAGDATVAASHELADRVEQVLRDDLAAGDVVVHVEPA